MPKGQYVRSATQRQKFRVGAVRAHRRRMLRAAQLSAGHALGRDLNIQPPERVQAQINVTPAVWRGVHDCVGDCEYVDDGLDEVLMRALHERVVYAQSVCCHHEPLFQDVTYALLTDVEKQYRKNGKPKKVPVPVKMLSDPVKIVKLAKKTGHREGRPLLAVVEEMFKS